VLEVARAVSELDEPRLRLCVIGPDGDGGLVDELAALGQQAVRIIGSRPVADAARLTLAADLVCLHQDPASELACYQVPMKLTEALAMEVPVLVTPTPALRPFVDSGVVGEIGGSLAAAVDEVLTDRETARSRAQRGREHFLRHLSYEAVGPVLDEVLREATRTTHPPAGAVGVVVAEAREVEPCPRGGPAGHSEGDRAAATRLVGALSRDVRAKLRDTLHGVRTCALLGYPNHRNPGDHAVWLAAKRLLRDLGVHVVYEADWVTYSQQALSAAVEDGAAILLTGGGNFGDLWPNTQGLRERVLAEFPGVRTIQLPQSVHFDSPESRERVGRLLERHGDVTLLLRDPESLERARAWFDVPSELVPDLGFAVRPPVLDGEPVADVVWVARTDKESLGFQPPARAAGVELLDWMPPADAELVTRPDLDPHIRERIGRNAAIVRAARRGEEINHRELPRLWEHLSRDRLALACAIVRRGRVVVTDRLHVHVMALQMGIPTVVSDNSYGKVRAVYDAFTVSAPTVRWGRTPEDALETARGWLGGLVAAA
jgi:pyruvyl transferase EpsO